MREVMAVPLETSPPAASVSFKACIIKQNAFIYQTGTAQNRKKKNKKEKRRGTEIEMMAIAYNGVKEDGLVKSRHGRIDWILVVRVVEFISSDPFDFFAEIAVLFRIRDPC